MPLAELAELGPADRRGRRAGLRRRGRRACGRRSRRSASSRPRTYSRSATAGSIAANDEELADRITLLRFHGSRDKKDFEAVGYNSRLDELQAAVLRLFLRSWTAGTRARRDAAARYERARPRRALRAAGRRARPRLPHVRRPLAGAGPLRRGARRPRDRARVVLRDAAPPAARAALPRLAGGLAPGDRAGRAREPRAADVGRDPGGDAGAGGRRPSARRAAVRA